QSEEQQRTASGQQGQQDSCRHNQLDAAPELRDFPESAVEGTDCCLQFCALEPQFLQFLDLLECGESARKHEQYGQENEHGGDADKETQHRFLPSRSTTSL